VPGTSPTNTLPVWSGPIPADGGERQCRLPSPGIQSRTGSGTGAGTGAGVLPGACTALRSA
jgi:hypothetical protein